MRSTGRVLLLLCVLVTPVATHPRGYGNNARVLGYYVRELRLITLEDAIRKMTSLPAQTFGFRDRGLIRVGFAADLVIFDERTITDRATYDNPHQFPSGISYVLVNGRTVLAGDQMTDARPGVTLRGIADVDTSANGKAVKNFEGR